MPSKNKTYINNSRVLEAITHSPHSQKQDVIDINN